MRDNEELRPLARSLTELRTLSVVALGWGGAGFAGLLVVEESSDVLVGCVLAVAFMLAVWIPAQSRATLRRGARAGAQALLPAPPEAQREEPSETVRRMVSGRTRMVPVFVLLLLLPGAMYGPSRGHVGIVAGVTIGIVIAAGLENLRRAVRLARWQRRYQQTILLERSPTRPWRRKHRQAFSEPSTD